MSSKGNIKSEATATKKYRRHTPEEKAALLERYYKIPQPCSQRNAAAILGISQPSFCRLFRANINIEEKKVKAKKEEPTKTKVYVDTMGKLNKRLTNKEKVDILNRYERLQPCTQRKAATMLGVPQSTLSDILKANDFVEEIEEPCKGKKSKKGKQETPIKLALRPSTRKSTFFTKLDLETLEGGDASDSSWKLNVNHSNTSDEQDSSDESDDPNVIPNQKKERNPRRKRSCKSEEDRIELYKKYLDLQPCTQKEASIMLGIGQSTLCVLLKKFSNDKSLPKPAKRAKIISKEDMSSGAASSSVTNKKCMPLEEKIQLLRKFDEMQPCSQKKAANTFGVSLTTFANIVFSRTHLEDDFKNKLPKKMEILKKYDEWLVDCNKNDSDIEKSFSLSKKKLDNLLNHREFLEQEFKNCDLSAHERMVHGRKDVETALISWYHKNSQSHITWTKLMEKAKELAANLDGKEFNPTVKWMMNWKRNLYAFNKNRSCKLGERVDLNESGSILSALKDYHPDNIFNMDESGLYYRAIPGLSPDKSDWVTVVFACNMSGNEKIKPLVIGKMEMPMFLSIVSLPVNYKYHNKAQMSGQILSDYLKEWDRQLAETNRRIALLLDNCGSHSTEDLSFEHIRLYLIPSEAAVSCQPLRYGIISRAKTLYRKKLQDSLNKMADDNNKVAELVSKMSLMDAMFILGSAWDEVPSKPIITAFSKLVFPTNSGPSIEDTEVADEEMYRLNQLDEDIQVHPNQDGLDFLDPGILNEEYTIVHMDGILLSDDEDEDNGESAVDESCDDEQETQDNEGAEMINSAADVNAEERGGSLPANDSLDLLGEDLPSNGRKSCGSWLDQDDLSVTEDRVMLNTSTEILNDNLPGPAVIDISGVKVTNKNVFEDPSDPPCSTEVQKALNIIKRFLKLNGGTLEDLTDYAQLENKVLSKL